MSILDKNKNKLNVFNPDFFKRNPKLGYQYKVEFFINGFEDDGKEFHYTNHDYYPRVLSTCVNGVTIPNIKTKNTPYISNYLYNIVEYDFSDMSLTLSFEENDDMIVNRLLMHMLTNQRPTYKSGETSKTFLSNSYMNTIIVKNGVDELFDFLDIYVFEIDPNKNTSENYSSGIVHVFKHCYVIKSENVTMEYTESPKGVTMNIEFGFLQYFISRVGKNSNITSISKIIDDQNEKIAEEINNEKMASAKDDAKKVDEKQFKELASTKAKGEGSGTMDLDITDEEIQKSWEKKLTDADRKKISYEKFAEMSKNNAARMRVAYKNVLRLLESKGYSLSINDYNGYGHEPGLGEGRNGSHNTGANLDVTLIKNNKRLDQMSITEEDVKVIRDTLKEAGFAIMFEKQYKNGKQDDGTSLWGHLTLLNQYRADGKGGYEEKKVTGWVKEKDGMPLIHNVNSTGYETIILTGAEKETCKANAIMNNLNNRRGSGVI